MNNADTESLDNPLKEDKGSPKPGFRRRTFLKGLSASISAVTLDQMIPGVVKAATAKLTNYTKMTCSHFGAFTAKVKDGIFVKAIPFAMDKNPSKMIEALPDRVNSNTRVKYPMVRASYLKDGIKSDRSKRGTEPFVQVSWEKALDLVAAEMTRVKKQYGNEAIFGGSNGWRCAGMLHDPQRLLKRFLTGFGGFVNEGGGYSWPASKAILPMVLGSNTAATGKLTTYKNIIENTKFLILWGTAPLRNGQIMRNGGGEHTTEGYFQQIKNAGIETLYINPVADQEVELLNAQWLKPRPNTDTALMLGIAHTLHTEGLYDQEFLAKLTVGFKKFEPYLLGKTDGQPKSAEWAAKITEIDADTIRKLARKMAKTRTFIMAGPALQRQDHGEQTFWSVIMLSSMLGQIGLPGGGFGFGYGYYAGYGQPRSGVSVGGPGTGKNPVKISIPTARIADMLLSPGETIDFKGKKVTYPDIKLVWWSGGNPIVHHQDINRLLRAWQRPETIIVNEPWWTNSARYADIVFPATSNMERNDIARRKGADRYIMAMQKVVDPIGESRNDFDIFAAVADRLGFKKKFTEDLTEMQWLQKMYQGAQKKADKKKLEMPDFNTFWKTGYVKFPEENVNHVLYAAFRKDPYGKALGTPSGKIELYSPKIAKFKYDDCPPHPTWMEPYEWLGSEKAKKHPLHLVSSHPLYRLHSQLNNTWLRDLYEVKGREPMLINPEDAKKRGITDGEVVRVFNDRGQILAGVVITEKVRPGVIQIAEGAWYDPAEPGKIGSLCKHGCNNVLAHDVGSSKLGQGSTVKTMLVEVEKYKKTPPAITAFIPPVIIKG